MDLSRQASSGHKRPEQESSMESREPLCRLRERLAIPPLGSFHCAAGGMAGAEGDVAAVASPFTRSFSSLLGLKNGIFLAGTSTRSPVFGLRPTRELRWRVRKLPKPRISILSPARNECTMLSKMVSTITSLSRRVTSVIRATSSIRSAFVISCTFHLRCGVPSSANREPGSEFCSCQLAPEIEESGVVGLQHSRLRREKLGRSEERRV